MTVKSSISLTDAQHAFAKGLVEDGRYSSVSAVLQQGVELLRAQTEAADLERAALAELLRRRLDGPTISMDEFDERVERMIARKRREHGIPD